MNTPNYKLFPEVGTKAKIKIDPRNPDYHKTNGKVVDISSVSGFSFEGRVFFLDDVMYSYHYECFEPVIEKGCPFDEPLKPQPC